MQGALVLVIASLAILVPVLIRLCFSRYAIFCAFVVTSV